MQTEFADKREVTMAYPVPVARAALVDGAGRILLGLRKDGQRWELPGGKIEGGESAEECARRETLEECGLKCTGHGELVGVTNVKHLSKERHSLEVCYAFPEWHEAGAGEHDNWRWFTRQEALSLPLMPSTRRFLTEWLPGFMRRHQDWPPVPLVRVGPVS